MGPNSLRCVHCGKIFHRFPGTPSVIRSDGKTFHVTLLCGPDPIGSFDGEAMCTFVYANDRIAHGDDFTFVSVFQENRAADEESRQLETVADRLAALVAEGKKLERTYRFEAGQLLPRIAA